MGVGASFMAIALHGNPQQHNAAVGASAVEVITVEVAN